MHTKLEEILNRAFPEPSKIRLKVYPIVSERGYNIQIFKNNNALEQFSLPVTIVNRLVEK